MQGEWRELEDLQKKFGDLDLVVTDKEDQSPMFLKLQTRESCQK